jgi:hypothetical protein
MPVHAAGFLAPGWNLQVEKSHERDHFKEDLALYDIEPPSWYE